MHRFIDFIHHTVLFLCKQNLDYFADGVKIEPRRSLDVGEWIYKHRRAANADDYFDKMKDGSSDDCS